MARALAETTADSDRLALARAFGSRLISAWWDALTRAEHAPPPLHPPLPDIILADLGPAGPLIVFTEVVATDGAVTARRQEALLALTDEAGFSRGQVAFFTAYQDRESAGLRKTVSGLAWGSFAWFVSEPDSIVILRDGAASPARLADLLAR